MAVHRDHNFTDIQMNKEPMKNDLRVLINLHASAFFYFFFYQIYPNIGGRAVEFGHSGTSTDGRLCECSITTIWLIKLRIGHELLRQGQFTRQMELAGVRQRGKRII